LQSADVNWVARLVTISKSLEETREGLRVKTTKSEKSRTCSLPQMAHIALQFLREQQQEYRAKFGADYQNPRFLQTGRQLLFRIGSRRRS